MGRILFAGSGRQSHLGFPYRPMPQRIVHFNDPVLRKKGARVVTFDTKLAQLAQDMIETMHEARGIGLAAQQIGLALQLCVVDLRDVDRDFTWKLDGVKTPIDLFMPMALVNPDVKVQRGCEEEPYEEGCLSFPNIRGDVVRPTVITAKYQDVDGIAHVLECDGLLARCIQHEVDHLNGVLYIDRMDKKVRASIDDAVKALAKETRDLAKNPPL